MWANSTSRSCLYDRRDSDITSTNHLTDDSQSTSSRCRPSCRRHSDALLSVTAFQSHHLLHWPWCCFSRWYLSITILIIWACFFITVNVVAPIAWFMSNIRHQPPYLVLKPPYPHLSRKPLPPRDLWSCLFNDATRLGHKYSKHFPQWATHSIDKHVYRLRTSCGLRYHVEYIYLL